MEKVMKDMKEAFGFGWRLKRSLIIRRKTRKKTYLT